MTIHHEHGLVTLHAGNCLDVIRELPDSSVDAVVTDPPYGLANTTPNQVADTIVRWVNGDRDYIPSGAGFMGKAWDAFVPPVAVWDECLRVLKPGGHVLAFAGSRTHDLMTLGIRLAGFDIRDGVAWLYGSGFPKSLDVSKAINATQRHGGANSVSLRRAAMGDDYRPSGAQGNRDGYGGAARAGDGHFSGELTEDAEQWQGWGTALKPAFEPIVVGRKPLGEKSVAANVLTHGTGALNIDACRIDGGARPLIISKSEESTGILGNGLNGSSHGGETTAGRWPANVILDESQAAELDKQSGPAGSNSTTPGSDGASLAFGARKGGATHDTRADGGASRFFYVAKADASERVRVDGIAHPTVKPLDLMRWLVRLVTPPGGTVLEPFAGSGTTVEACLLEGFHCIAIEREADYLPLIQQRIHRRVDPVAAVRGAGVDGGLFDLLEGSD